MAWETKTFHFECRGCSEPTTAEAKKCPTWCIDCRDARTTFGSLMRVVDRYPRKSCKGCGDHLSNFDYGNHAFCYECAEFDRRRHNGWADPYADAPKRLVAANDNNPQGKTCTMCECDLPLDAFTKAAKGLSGYSSECRGCRAIIRAERGRDAEYAKRVRPDQKPRRKAIKLRKIERFNRIRLKERRAIGRKLDVYLAKFNKPWTHPALSEADKYRVRYANDNEYMLRERTRQRMRRKGLGFDALWRMRRALNGQEGAVGKATIEAALGYSMTELHDHLESLFNGGMTWEAFRRGEIHIDHKKPLSRFDLDDPAQVVEAWSLANLQPLWAADNMAKGAKTDEEWRSAA